MVLIAGIGLFKRGARATVLRNRRILYWGREVRAVLDRPLALLISRSKGHGRGGAWFNTECCQWSVVSCQLSKVGSVVRSTLEAGTATVPDPVFDPRARAGVRRNGGNVNFDPFLTHFCPSTLTHRTVRKCGLPLHLWRIYRRGIRRGSKGGSPHAAALSVVSCLICQLSVVSC